MPDAILPSTILALPFVAAVLAWLLRSRGRNLAVWLMTGTALLGLLLALWLYPAITGGGALRQLIPWAPGLGLDLVLRVDGFAWLFMLLICGIGALVGIYARYYMPADDPLARFFALLLAFMGSMLGIVMSGNVLQLVFFWELTSLFSFLLIGYWHHGASARDGARMALVVTSGGGLCLLAGVLLLGHIVGSYDLDVILAAGDAVRAHALYLPTLLLILLGAFTKSAQFPFHFWLPQAMSAPTPVSAYLHSATMVKAGVFLLVRFWPVLGGTDAWFWIVGGTGLLTLVLGAYAAMFEQDLKGVLAYSTISHLGLITMLVGLGSALGVVAAIFHIVNHATFKASLFMAAGAVDHEAGTRDLRKLGGLRRFMPVTATLALIAGAAMAGVPLLNGFLSKEMFFAETLASRNGPLLDVLSVVIAVAASAFGVTYSIRFVRGVFFGRVPATLPREPHEPPLWMRVPIGLLALACLLVGVLPARVIGPSLRAAASAVLGAGQLPPYSLAVWHGVTTPLLMSVLAFGAGCLLFVSLRRCFATLEAAPLTGRFSGKRIFERVMAVVAADLPQRIERRYPSRRLQPQLLLIVLLALVAGTLAATSAPFGFQPRWSSVDPAFALLWLLGAACAIGAASQAKFHRLAALVLTGGAGLVSCVSFVWLSAPDLAATQLLVEVVTTILILLGLRWLPKRIEGLAAESRTHRFRRRRDMVIATAVGLGVASLAYAAMMHPVADSISRFFLERAYTEGGGHNVVNVILVDFRGFDTLGEISVLAIVALTVFALLRRFRPAAESINAPAQQRLQTALGASGPGRAADHSLTDYLMIPGLIIQLMAPVIVLFGLHLFLRGHDLPGGGFVAGITVSVALILLYMARGARWVEAHLRVLPVRWIGLGLLLAAGTGLGSLAFGRPFLTSYFRHVELPVLGELPLASAVLFDLGVFVVVVGATTLMLIALAHQSLRRPRQAPATAAEGEG
ncbi:cation:proton antiporter [Rhodanobacter thiooxydans]|uniref:Cation:proton antiporter n=1 Tax=Rhodanobacter thiooxydans TaxID=416169 RepID=A0A154QHA2_9GAMM|nr:monovalent cation/H+ antiporter subunit A [Rhodanobacter thiooxydans]EIM03342.1 putative monovalent cation/H+ antiporter subunit A [Rhodanobacter thiooxydans LCS2]KZC23368.1 cation:proton antiporter [Rhodanobacter thiooxydans]MCW0201439.1 monovalent cation/H+ antiporter subunit A [Rhodanobacter thiooxydans]